MWRANKIYTKKGLGAVENTGGGKPKRYFKTAIMFNSQTILIEQKEKKNNKRNKRIEDFTVFFYLSMKI